MDAKKSRILYIKRFLEKQTDEEHPATIMENHCDLCRALNSLPEI